MLPTLPNEHKMSRLILGKSSFYHFYFLRKESVNSAWKVYRQTVLNDYPVRYIGLYVPAG